MKNHSYLVYMTMNPRESVIYTGVTNNLIRRLTEHYLNRGKPDTFAGKYFCFNLVWYEWHQYIYDAIAREKQIKRLSREEKLAMIHEFNPKKQFFNVDICGVWPPTSDMIKDLGLDKTSAEATGTVAPDQNLPS